MAIVYKADDTDSLQPVVSEVNPILLGGGGGVLPSRYVKGKLTAGQTFVGGNVLSLLTVDQTSLSGDTSLISGNDFIIDQNGIWFVQLTLANLNTTNITNSGVYFATGSAGRPVGMEVSSYQTKWFTGVFTAAVGDVFKFYAQAQASGSLNVSSWEDYNGFTFGQLGFVDEYADTETFTGKYWFGKKIYRKVLDIPALPSTVGDTAYPHNILNADLAVSCRLLLFNPNGRVSEHDGSAVGVADDPGEIVVYFDLTSIGIRVGQNRSAYLGKVIIEYTCTDR